jgi:sn-glycerol 3-phosphate transport system permease protein
MATEVVLPGEEPTAGHGPSAVLAASEGAVPRARWVEVARLYGALLLPLFVLVVLGTAALNGAGLRHGSLLPKVHLGGALPDVARVSRDGYLLTPWPSVLVALLVAIPLAAFLARTLDHGHELRLVSLAGQYELLSLLAMVVLGPVLFTVISALSPPFLYVDRGSPLHPVAVDWKDRTWFTGGPFSVVIRTLTVLLLFTWIQRIASGESWRRWRTSATPARLGSIVGGTVALTLAIGPAFRSLHDADGNSEWYVLGAMALVAATQLPGLWDRARRRPAIAVLEAVCVGALVTGAMVVFVGAEVWTQSWGSADLGPAMQRSLVMAVAITVLQVSTSVMAAYAFVFLEFPFKRLLFALFMGTLLLPLEVTLIGNVALIRQLGWLNSYQALVLPFAASALGTFLIRQGFRGIPPEIQDATRLDGYGHLSFLTKFAVPLTRPVIASFTVISALQAWNQYLWPRAVIDNDSFNTLQVQLRTSVTQEVAQANISVAAALVAAFPVLVLLIAFQRQIIRGLTAGAVK